MKLRQGECHNQCWPRSMASLGRNELMSPAHNHILIWWWIIIMEGIFAAKSCVKQTWRTLVWYHKIHCFSVRTSLFISILPWNYVKFIFAIKLFQIKSNYTWINYSHDNIAIRSHMMIHNFVWNLILVANLIAFISQKQKCVFFTVIW